MLIVTRRYGEAVCIGPNVTVRILGFKGAQVRVGIEAPTEVEVDREEVRARKERERRTTSTPSA